MGARRGAGRLRRVRLQGVGRHARGALPGGHCFPFSNVSLAQCFWGETSECVCEGLKAVFEFCEGVPPGWCLTTPRASAEGSARLSLRRHVHALRRPLRVRLLLLATPTPATRRAPWRMPSGPSGAACFVPVPRIDSLPRLQQADPRRRCLDRAGKDHYLKGEPKRQLFMEDCVAMADLPAKPFARVAKIITAQDRQVRRRVPRHQTPLPARGRTRRGEGDRRTGRIPGSLLRRRGHADRRLRPSIRGCAHQGQRPHVAAGRSFLREAGRMAERRRQGDLAEISGQVDGFHGQGRQGHDAQDASRRHARMRATRPR